MPKLNHRPKTIVECGNFGFWRNPNMAHRCTLNMFISNTRDLRGGERKPVWILCSKRLKTQWKQKNATKTRTLTHCFFRKKHWVKFGYVSKSCNAADPPLMLVRAVPPYKSWSPWRPVLHVPGIPRTTADNICRGRMSSSSSSSKRGNCLSDHRWPHAYVSVALTVMDLFFLLSLFLALFIFLLKRLVGKRLNSMQQTARNPMRAKTRKKTDFDPLFFFRKCTQYVY